MTIRLIHVGLGGWGQNWSESVVAPNKDVETVAWVEIVDEVMVAAQKKLGLPPERCFASLDEALTKVEADAVLITANLPGHVPSAVTALQAGKHVLLEKPFAPTIAEAQKVVDLAEEHKKILMISQNYRFAPAVKAVTKLIKQKDLGRVGSVSLDFRRYANIAPFETTKHYKIWHPLLVDMSIHHFDLMRMVLDQEPVEISCVTSNPHWSRFVEPPTATATIVFDGGAVVSYRGSWVSMGPETNWGGDWCVECGQGEIVWTSRGEQPESVKLRPLGKPSSSLSLSEDTTPRDRSGSLEAFVLAVKTNTQPATSGRDNIKTLALMFAAVESASANGQPVAINAFIDRASK